MLYDSLVRVKQVTDAKDRIVTAAYDDASGKVTVTKAYGDKPSFAGTTLNCDVYGE